MLDHAALSALSDRLTLQYAGAMGAGAVLRAVVRAFDDLRRGSTAEPRLEMVEEVARRRLVERLASMRLQR